METTSFRINDTFAHIPVKATDYEKPHNDKLIGTEGGGNDSDWNPLRPRAVPA